MAATKYTYSLANDFPATGLASDRLDQEIHQSAIETALDRVDTEGDVVDIWFKAALSAADKTILDGDISAPAGGLIAAHSGEPLDSTVVSPVILEPTGNSAKNLLIHGRKFAATLNADTTYDVAFAEERDIQGVSFEISGHHADDWVRMAIVHPTTSDEIRVLAEGASGAGVPVPNSGVSGAVSEGTATLAAGVPIRITYHSAATAGDPPQVHLLFRTWV